MAEESDAMHKVTVDSAASAGTTSLGALLKAKMDVKNTEQ
jgi:small subunit ribosomal protein S1